MDLCPTPQAMPGQLSTLTFNVGGGELEVRSRWQGGLALCKRHSHSSGSILERN